MYLYIYICIYIYVYIYISVLKSHTVTFPLSPSLSFSDVTKRNKERSQIRDHTKRESDAGGF